MITGTAASDKVLVFVSCGSAEEAARLARTLVEKRLVACAAVDGAVRSWFQWKGVIEEVSEYRLVLKTKAERLPEMEQEIRRLHSYETPEILVVAIAAGSQDYLEWMDGSLERRGAEE